MCWIHLKGVRTQILRTLHTHARTHSCIKIQTHTIATHLISTWKILYVFIIQFCHTLQHRRVYVNIAHHYQYISVFAVDVVLCVMCVLCVFRFSAIFASHIYTKLHAHTLFIDVLQLEDNTWTRASEPERESYKTGRCAHLWISLVYRLCVCVIVMCSDLATRQSVEIVWNTNKYNSICTLQVETKMKNKNKLNENFQYTVYTLSDWILPMAQQQHKQHNWELMHIVSYFGIHILCHSHKHYSMYIVYNASDCKWNENKWTTV